MLNLLLNGIYTNQNPFLEIETHKIIWDFEIQTFGKWSDDRVLINKKTENMSLVDFVIQTNRRVKMKESEKIDKYLDFARELKKTVTVIPIVISAPGTVLKIKGKFEIIQTKAMLRTTKILRRVLETWKALLLLGLQYIWFVWVWFYGISNTVGYLMPNPFYKYISNIGFLNPFCR